MSKRHALIIGIETYRDPDIPRFDYAEADARALAALWPADEVELLHNESATKTLIESRVRKFGKARGADDSLTLVYFGHAFAFEGDNYLSCNDTLAEDLDLTSLPLEALMERGGIDVLFLDGARFPLADPFQPEALPGPAFLSCGAGEVSYTAALLGQGVWAHHLLAALQQPAALSGADLQQQLVESIPVTLRKVFSDEVPRTQTPCVAGGAEALVIKPATEGEAVAATGGGLKHIVLAGVRAGKIKSLSGYNKQWHSLPEEINDKSTALIESLGETEVEEEAQRLFQEIKTAFKYKRREIECDSGTGCATIRTPDFDVDLNIAIDPEDLSGYLIETAVCRFKTPEVMQSEAFAVVFSSAFNVLRFDFSRSFDVEEIVDAIEDLEEEAVQVVYPPDCSSCSITTTTLPGELLFDERGFRIQLDRSCAPIELLESFVAAQELLGPERLLPGGN